MPYAIALKDNDFFENRQAALLIWQQRVLMDC